MVPFEQAWHVVTCKLPKMRAYFGVQRGNFPHQEWLTDKTGKRRYFASCDNALSAIRRLAPDPIFARRQWAIRRMNDYFEEIGNGR